MDENRQRDGAFIEKIKPRRYFLTIFGRFDQLLLRYFHKKLTFTSTLVNVLRLCHLHFFGVNLTNNE